MVQHPRKIAWASLKKIISSQAASSSLNGLDTLLDDLPVEFVYNLGDI